MLDAVAGLDKILSVSILRHLERACRHTFALVPSTTLRTPPKCPPHLLTYHPDFPNSKLKHHFAVKAVTSRKQNGVSGTLKWKRESENKKVHWDSSGGSFETRRHVSMTRGCWLFGYQPVLLPSSLNGFEVAVPVVSRRRQRVHFCSRKLFLFSHLQRAELRCRSCQTSSVDTHVARMHTQRSTRCWASPATSPMGRKPRFRQNNHCERV